VRQRNLFLEEPGFVVVANLASGYLSTVAARLHLLSTPLYWTLAALLVFVALSAINTASAWKFEGKWTRGFWGLLAFYEALAVGASVWWWAQGR
jgi:hypothetical protein